MLRFSPLRRLSSALAMVLLLQLALQGTGTPCARNVGAGLHSSHAAMSGGSASISGVGADQPCRDTQASDGCQVPSSPTGCTATVSCVSLAAVPAAPVVVALDPAPDAKGPGEPPPLHSAPVRAPELPPPRG